MLKEKAERILDKINKISEIGLKFRNPKSHIRNKKQIL